MTPTRFNLAPNQPPEPIPPAAVASGNGFIAGLRLPAHGAVPAPIPPPVTRTSQPEAALPLARAHSQGDGKAFVALICGILSLFGILVPVAGLPLSITGFAVGSLSLRGVRRSVAMAAVVLSGLGLVASVASFAYQYVVLQKGTDAALGVVSISSGPTRVAETNCYRLKLTGSFTIDNSAVTCATTAALANGAETIKLQAYPDFDTHFGGTISYSQLRQQAEQEISDLAKAHPSLQIISRQDTTFAGLQAYEVVGRENNQYNVSVYLRAGKRYDVGGGVRSQVFILDYSKLGANTINQLNSNLSFK